MPRIFRRLIPIVAATILVVSILALFTTSQASESGIAMRILPDANSWLAKNQLVDYYARNSYNAGHANNASSQSSALNSIDTVQVLQALQDDQPQDKRTTAISTLTQAPPAIIPVLVDALSHSNAGVRRGAAEVLGARRAIEAENSLFFATFDAHPGVRIAAIRALGGLGAIYALPRLQWLQVADDDPNVQLAAHLSENQIYWRVAATLNVSPGDLHAIAISSVKEQVYAATKSELYVLQGVRWKRVGPLPDIPTTLAVVGNDGRILYLGTASYGMFRSVDAGQTWHSISESLTFAQSFAVTALAINPENEQQLFIALATNTTKHSQMTFGVYSSLDGGDTWFPLGQSNVDSLTTRLVVDSTPPARLLGLTDKGVWQYLLANPKREP
ncbi:MAG: HEAT repeat domain-containing protein [Chloroflexi bacterium]|nr:HEAT repeat domain-containing protein [Chloroflexota bacterium]